MQKLKDKIRPNERWHPYWNWECFKGGLYEKGKDMNKVQKCATLLSDSEMCYQAMRRAVDEYPISAQQHLTKPTGRRPWIGAAACNVALGANEEEVRIAWNFYMTAEQQKFANDEADRVIHLWEAENAKA